MQISNKSNKFSEQIFDSVLTNERSEYIMKKVNEQMFGTDIRRSVFGMYAAEIAERNEIRRNRRAKALKQQKTRRKMFFIFLLTLLMMFGIGVGFGTLLTRAEEPEKEPAYKYYTNIEIQSGDTLWEIADSYMDSAHYMSRTDYINEVMSINHMVTDRLIAGQKMIVPYYSAEEK